MRSFYPTTHRLPPERDPDTWKTLLHRASNTPGLAYELAPNVSMTRWDLPLRTNSLGMRDREPLPADTPDLVRICALGDSFTFGVGVRSREAYPNVAEKMLRKAYPDQAIEVLNMAVSGYSSSDEVQVLRYKALLLNPSLVTVGYYLNDPETEAIQPLHAAFAPVHWWQHSTLLRRFDQALYDWDLRRYGNGDQYRYLSAPEGPAWPHVVEAFAQMAALTRPRKIPVLLVIFPEPPLEGWSEYRYADLHRQIYAAARDAGLEALDLLGPFEEYFSWTLRVVPSDHHPSRLAHQVAAESIVAYLQTHHADLLSPRRPAGAALDRRLRTRASRSMPDEDRQRPTAPIRAEPRAMRCPGRVDTDGGEAQAHPVLRPRRHHARRIASTSSRSRRRPSTDR